MTKQDKEQLNLEISHIFESGANHERIFNMVEMFIDRRYQALTIPVVSKCYTEKDMDNAYDKGFKDGNNRDLTGSLIEVL